MTRSTRRDFLEAGFRPVDCATCGNRVLVRKSSMAQTSIQWTTGGVTHCPRFAERVTSGQHTALIDGCPDLAETIAAGVRQGMIEVADA